MTARDTTSDERFPREKECQQIVLAVAREYCGYDYPSIARGALTRISKITAGYDSRGKHIPGLHPSTVGKVLEEADPRTGRWRQRGNRKETIHLLIYAFAHEYCGDGEGGLASTAPERIARLVSAQGGTIEPDDVRRVLEDAIQTVESNA